MAAHLFRSSWLVKAELRWPMRRTAGRDINAALLNRPAVKNDVAKARRVFGLFALSAKRLNDWTGPQCLDHSRPNCLRNSSFARINTRRRVADRLPPARLI